MHFYRSFSSWAIFENPIYPGGEAQGFLEAKMARYLVFCNTFLCFSKCIKRAPSPPLLVPRGFSEKAPGAQGGQKTQGSWQPDRVIPRKRKQQKIKKRKNTVKYRVPGPKEPREIWKTAFSLGILKVFGFLGKRNLGKKGPGEQGSWDIGNLKEGGIYIGPYWFPKRDLIRPYWCQKGI